MSVEPAQHVYSVSELNGLIRRVLEADRRLLHCYVTGEISNFKHHGSGHMYFTLKDEQSRIRAVMFAGKNRSLPFRPNDGMRVIVTGAVSVYDRDGSYQIYVEDMQPDGVGALYVAFNQLKARLEQEGLFQRDRKRELPRFPGRIGVVTSPTGAVIRDICSTLRRRYPNAKVLLSPAQVQGPTAALTLVRGLQRLIEYSRQTEAVDVIIVARGGGSLEELWPFNEEVVARAIAASPIPVVSAVGHETDFTISDFVADVRAATPTAAAELVAPALSELRLEIGQCLQRSQVALASRLERDRTRLERIGEARILKEPARLMRSHRQTVDFLESQVQQFARKPLSVAERSLHRLMQRLQGTPLTSHVRNEKTRLERIRYRAEKAVHEKRARGASDLERMAASLTALNPLAVLSRGYSVVYAAPDFTQVVTSVQQLHEGDLLRLRMQDGERSARVVEEDGGESHGDGVQTRLDI